MIEQWKAWDWRKSGENDWYDKRKRDIKKSKEEGKGTIKIQERGEELREKERRNLIVHQEYEESGHQLC